MCVFTSLHIPIFCFITFSASNFCSYSPPYTSVCVCVYLNSCLSWPSRMRTKPDLNAKLWTINSCLNFLQDFHFFLCWHFLPLMCRSHALVGYGAELAQWNLIAWCSLLLLLFFFMMLPECWSCHLISTGALRVVVVACVALAVAFFALLWHNIYSCHVVADFSSTSECSLPLLATCRSLLVVALHFVIALVADRLICWCVFWRSLTTTNASMYMYIYVSAKVQKLCCPSRLFRLCAYITSRSQLWLKILFLLLLFFTFLLLLPLCCSVPWLQIEILFAQFVWQARFCGHSQPTDRQTYPSTDRSAVRQSSASCPNSPRIFLARLRGCCLSGDHWVSGGK